MSDKRDTPVIILVSKLGYEPKGLTGVRWIFEDIFKAICPNDEVFEQITHDPLVVSIEVERNPHGTVS